MNVTAALLATSALLVLLLAACGGDGAEESVRTVPPGSPAPDVSTGVPELDQTVNAALRGDVIELAGLTGYQSIPCDPAAPEDGDTPRCRASESAGEEVDVLPVFRCELAWIRPEQVPDVYAEVLGNETRTLLAVYRPLPTLFMAFGADYVAVIETPGGTGAAFAIKGGRAISVQTDCGNLAQLYDAGRVVSFVVEPDGAE